MLLKSKLNDLKKTLNNSNVLANLEERYCYSTDASNLKRDTKTPDLVVFVETIEDVQNVVKYANIHHIPIIPRGAGTNMVGACVCNNGGIVLNFSKMNKILEINQMNLTVRVQPGVVLETLKNEVEKFNLYYPPDPSNYKVSTIGGSIAQSSGGAKAFKYGTTKDYIISLKVVTANGEIIELGSQTSKNSVGYHLEQIFVGSEGTLGIVVEATLKLIPKPQVQSLLAVYFNETNSMMNFVNSVLHSGIYPSAIDFMDKNSIKTVEEYANLGLNLTAKYLLLMEIEGESSSLNEQGKILDELLKKYNLLYEFTSDKQRIDDLWHIRKVSYSATTRLAPDVISDDLIVPRDKVSELIDICNSVTNKYNLKMCLVGHLGDGNIHPQIALDLNNDIEFRNYTKAKSEIYDAVLKLGGSLSGEHGIGLDKREYFAKNVEEEKLNYMRQIKKIFDPNNILNPGKIFE